MANLKNWHPDMDDAERAWFDACPKAVLFEIARHFAMRIAGQEDAGEAFLVMRAEWDALHGNQIVPQKPFDVHKWAQKINRVLRERADRALALQSKVST